MKRILSCAALLVAMFTVSTDAMAAPMPPAVEAMIREAAKSPDKLNVVLDVAKATYPDSVHEIEALATDLEAKAQEVKVSKLLAAGPFDFWSGSAELGLSKTSGNTDETGIYFGAGLAKDGLQFRHKLNAKVDKQMAKGELTRSRYSTDYELDYKFDDRLYALGGVAWDRDTFAGFSRRFTESAGLGYSAFKGPRATLDVTLSPALRQTRYVTGRTERTTTVKAGIDGSLKVLNRLALSEKADVYASGAFNSVTALTGTITPKLSARLSFEIIHENDQLEGRDATDTATRFSLVYGF